MSTEVHATRYDSRGKNIEGVTITANAVGDHAHLHIFNGKTVKSFLIERSEWEKLLKEGQ